MKKVLLVFLTFIFCSQSSAQRTDDGGHEDWEFALEYSGDFFQFALPAAAITLTLVERDKEGTKKVLLSYATTIALTLAMKDLVGKERPEGRGSFDSFPSGHTSSAFAGAAFIQIRYGWKYGWPAYLMASITGVSRVEGPDGYHDFWDVLGGAAVGIGTVYLFTKPYDEKVKQFTFGFSSNRDRILISLYYQFP